MLDLLYWALQWSRNVDYPRDFDFVVTEPAYFDIGLYGEIWNPFCNPEAYYKNQFFSTNNGQPLILKTWRPVRWLPNYGGEIPAGFVAKRYKVIIYSDSIRTNVIKTIDGNVDIGDSYLLDEHDWFESKIINVTNSQSVGINQTLNIFCNVLQPRHSRLIITVQKGTQQPITIYDQSLSERIKEKNISIPYTFDSWSTHTFRYKLITRDLDWIDNWCPATNDYIEERETIITVGQE
jgi:hypothetical protein